MGYYIRVLGIETKDVPVSLLQEALETNSVQAKVTVESGEATAWNQIVIEHEDGMPIVSIERHPVVQGELGAEELEEFIEDIQDARPSSASKWLTSYLPKVKVIYALQILGGTEMGDGWRAVRTTHGVIWEQVKGILQADGEGFSNDEGYHILWQFSDHVKGPWSMALLDSGGKWVKFKMNLGNQKQRQAFLEGRIPPKAEIIP